MSQEWHGGKWIRNDKRLAIYLRDGHACLYCGSRSRLTLDHVVCRAHNGSNASKNLITACKSCNSSRGKLPLARFIRVIAVRLYRNDIRNNSIAHVGSTEHVAATIRARIRRCRSRNLAPFRERAKLIQAEVTP